MIGLFDSESPRLLSGGVSIMVNLDKGNAGGGSTVRDPFLRAKIRRINDLELAGNRVTEESKNEQRESGQVPEMGGYF